MVPAKTTRKEGAGAEDRRRGPTNRASTNPKQMVDSNSVVPSIPSQIPIPMVASSSSVAARSQVVVEAVQSNSSGERKKGIVDKIVVLEKALFNEAKKSVGIPARVAALEETWFAKISINGSLSARVNALKEDMEQHALVERE